MRKHSACVLPVLLLSLSAVLTEAEGSDTSREVYAPRTDWPSQSGGNLNISSFIFWDLNHNGEYDIGDRPMENVAVAATNPDGVESLRWSNFNGFANFPMSIRKTGAVISRAGDYTFDVVVPPGWSVSTKNLRQRIRFREMPGSVADIVGYPPFKPVGLVQDLVLNGEIVLPKSNLRGAKPGIEAFATGPSGKRRPISLDASGRYSIAATEGTWIIEVKSTNSAKQVKRTVKVGNAPVQISAIRPGEEMPEKGKTEKLVDFESVTPRNIQEMPNGIGGLKWWNMVAYRVRRAYANNSVSGNYVAYNSSGHPARISHEKGFDFAGGFFGVGWKKANGETLFLKGFRSGKLVYEDEITLSNIGPLWFDAEYRNITRLDLTTKHHWQFVSDDMIFRLKDGKAKRPFQQVRR